MIFTMDPLISDMKINEITRKTKGFTLILIHLDQKSGYGEVDIAVIYNRILTSITTFSIQIHVTPCVFLWISLIFISKFKGSIVKINKSNKNNHFYFFYQFFHFYHFSYSLLRASPSFYPSCFRLNIMYSTALNQVAVDRNIFQRPLLHISIVLMLDCLQL